MGTSIIIKNLSKRFGKVVAVQRVNLTIQPGTFLTLLGPSGCGKTTLLRCIAGLEDPDEGEIYIGDKLVFASAQGINVPAGQRDLGLVFQNYALWPHMTVFKNMTFALEIKKMNKEQMAQRVRDSLAEGADARLRGTLSARNERRTTTTHRARADVGVSPQSIFDGRAAFESRRAFAN
jgi:multiple sugar transport system ATP-binding protein